jgi:chromosome segregation ATPase
MVEPIMYFGIGFLVAALLALMFFPLVHRRAVRLTVKRLEAATPLTIAEIRADKDQLRAEFAMSTRRLELSVEQLKARATSQLAELGKKTDAINQLKKELGEKTASYFALEARDKALADQLRATEQEFSVKTGALREAERALSDKEADLAKLVGELGDHSIASDSQRVELAALRTQVEAMKVSVSGYERTVKDTEERLMRERGVAANDLTDARGKLDLLNTRKSDLEQQLLAQTTEVQQFNQRVQELEARLGEQGRLMAQREDEIERWRQEAEAARKAHGDLRDELASAATSSGGAVDRHKVEIARLEGELAAAGELRAKLESEIADLKRDAESGWASERVENALLRERINDVAAEVARLTAALEGPDSPIDAMLAAGAHDLDLGSVPANGSPPIAMGRGDMGRGDMGRGEAGPARINEQRRTLADRIRALQSGASRVASTN